MVPTQYTGQQLAAGTMYGQTAGLGQSQALQAPQVSQMQQAPTMAMQVPQVTQQLATHMHPPPLPTQQMPTMVQQQQPQQQQQVWTPTNVAATGQSYMQFLHGWRGRTA
jgi:hypothetical protein